MKCVLLSILIGMFSWKFSLNMMEDCPLPYILGVDFPSLAQINLNSGNLTDAFAFKPSLAFQFETLDVSKQYSKTFTFDVYEAI
jgi:hypothetical protein